MVVFLAERRGKTNIAAIFISHLGIFFEEITDAEIQGTRRRFDTRPTDMLDPNQFYLMEFPWMEL